MNELNEEEHFPNKVNEGLLIFKRGQNTIKRFIYETYKIAEEKCDGNNITIQKFFRDYNSTRPKFHMTIESVRTALEDFVSYTDGVEFKNDTITGLVRADL